LARAIEEGLLLVLAGLAIEFDVRVIEQQTNWFSPQQ
jgi:hypothetical protein